jgi:transcriptional regulator with XRE-family HTH domain
MDDNQLGDFLRAHREAVHAEDVGLRPLGRRGGRGLRRVEVARLASVSTDYYSRLEQGRHRNPSDQVLDAVARALGLDDAAVRHMHELAHPNPRPLPRPVRGQERVDLPVRRLVKSCEHFPACVLGRWMDVLAGNAMMDVLYAGVAYRDNMLRLTFLNPLARQFYLDWDTRAPAQVAELRATAGADPDPDPCLEELVEELCSGSDDFRALWSRYDVKPRTRGVRRFRHWEVGDLTLDYQALSVNSSPDQHLVTYQARPGSESERRLALLERFAGPETAPELAAVSAGGSP